MNRKGQKLVAMLMVVMMLCANLPIGALAETGMAAGDLPVIDTSGVNQPFAGVVGEPDAPVTPGGVQFPVVLFPEAQGTSEDSDISLLAMSPYNLTLDPQTVTLHDSAGEPETAQFTAIYHHGYGANTESTPLPAEAVTWSSGNPAVFTVDQGLVTAVAPGVAQLKATYQVPDAPNVTVSASVSIVVTDMTVRLTYQSNFPVDATAYYFDSAAGRASLVQAENTGVYEDYQIRTTVKLADPSVMFSVTNYDPVGYFVDVNGNGKLDAGEPEYSAGDEVTLENNMTLLVKWAPRDIVGTIGVWASYQYRDFTGKEKQISVRSEATILERTPETITVSVFLYGAYELTPRHEDTIEGFQGWVVNTRGNIIPAEDYNQRTFDGGLTFGVFSENTTITLVVPTEMLFSNNAGDQWVEITALPNIVVPENPNVVNATFFVLKRTFDNNVGEDHVDQYYNVGTGKINIEELAAMDTVVRAGGEGFLFELDDMDALIERNVTENVAKYIVVEPDLSQIIDQTHGAVAQNQRVIWYVVKKYDQGWHVDGIIINTDPNVRVQFRDATSRAGEDILLQEGLVKNGGDYSMDYVPDDTVFSQEDLHDFVGWATEPGGRPLTDEELEDLLSNLTEDVTLYAVYEDSRGYIIYYVNEFGESIRDVEEDYQRIDGEELRISDIHGKLDTIQKQKGSDIYQYEYTTVDVGDHDESAQEVSTSPEEPIIVITHHYYEMVDVVVKKVWTDGMYANLRPESVKVTLSADGQAMSGSEVQLFPADGWTHTWENLRMYRVGAASRADRIVYSVEEDDVPDYEVWSITSEEIIDHDRNRTVISLTIDNAYNPDWSIVKLVNGEKEIEAEVGEELTYTISVKNTGELELNGLLVYDEFLGGHAALRGDITWESVLEGGTPTAVFEKAVRGTQLGVINHLQVNETITLTYKYTVQPDDGDIDDGNEDQAAPKIKKIKNTAIVKAPGVKEERDDTTVTIKDTPLWEVHKVALVDGKELTDDDAVHVGDKIEYRITVTNTGNVYLRNMRLSDVFKVNGVETELTNWQPPQDTVFDLPMGKSRIFMAEYVVKAGDKNLHNKVTVNDDDPETPPETDETDNNVGTWTVKKVAIVDGVELTDADAVKVGDTVVYKITVTNTSDVKLENMQIRDKFTVDGEATELTNWQPALNTVFELEAGESFVFTAEYVVKAGDKNLHNVVVADDDPYDPEDPEDPDDPDNPPPTDETDNDVLHPHLTVLKKTVSVPANGVAYREGETIRYEITVTNDGNVTIENIKVMDSLSRANGRVIGTVEKLEPGETSTVFTFSHVVTAVDAAAGRVLNVATAEGDNPGYDPDRPDDPNYPPKVPAEPSEVEDPTVVPRITLTGTKTWVDNDNADGMRPESIEIVLYANGIRQRNVPTWSYDGNVWTYTFANLREVDANGVPIVYTVEETPVEYYIGTQDGMDFVNTIDKKEVALIDVHVVKTWQDHDNAGNTRPESITVELLRNGEVLQSAEVTEADDWQYSFTALPEGDGFGHLYVYTVREKMVPGYYALYDGTNITNVLLPERPDGQRNTPDFSGLTLEELSDMLMLFDYDVPLMGMLLGTGLELPMYPFVFAGLGVLALALALVFGRKRKER